MTRLISNWSVQHCDAQAFEAPELRDHIHLAGDIEGHDGPILTARIVRTEGRLVTTRSGSVYELGLPDPKYLLQLSERGIELDPVEPVKVRRAEALS